MGQNLISNDDVVIAANEPIVHGAGADDSAGDIIFRTGGVERARIDKDGYGSGLIGGPLPVLPRRRWLPELAGASLISTMASGWAGTNNAGTVTVADATVPGPFATTSVKMSSPSSGLAPLADLTVSADLTGTSLLVWVNYNGLIDADGNNPVVVVTAGDSSFTNFYQWSWKPPLFVPDSGWYCRELWTSNPATTTGTPSPSGIAKVRVRVNTGGTQTHVVNFGGIAKKTPSSVYANGVVTFTFDDGNASDFTLARPTLAAYGYAATAFPICDRVDSGQAADMTSAAYRQMVDQLGWEVGWHAYTTANHNTRYTGLSTTVVAQEFKNMQTWHAANGFQAEVWASPGGLCNQAVWDIARQYVYAHRDSEASTTTGLGLIQSVHPVAPYWLRSVDWDANATVVTVKAEIDKAKANKTWLVLNLHQIVASGASGEVMNQSDLDTIAAYCSSQGLAVRTIGRVMAEAGVSL